MKKVNGGMDKKDITAAVSGLAKGLRVAAKVGKAPLFAGTGGTGR